MINPNISEKRELAAETQCINLGRLVIAAVNKCCAHSCIFCRIHELFASEVSKVSTFKDC